MDGFTVVCFGMEADFFAVRCGKAGAVPMGSAADRGVQDCVGLSDQYWKVAPHADSTLDPCSTDRSRAMRRGFGLPKNVWYVRSGRS